MARVKSKNILLMLILFISHTLFYLVSNLYSAQHVSSTILQTQPHHDSVKAGLEESNFDFLILIKSAPENVKERSFLRSSSWLSYNWKTGEQGEISWRHFFLIGRSNFPEWTPFRLNLEKDEFNDVINAPFLDSLTRQTYKMMWAFRQLYDNFHFKFLVVVDEDVVANISDLNSYLQGLIKEGKDQYFYGGSSCGQRQVDRLGEWETPVEVWPHNLYPPYCDGSALIYSYNTIGELLWVWDHDRQPVINIDEAHIGVLIFYSGNIQITEIGFVTMGCHKLRRDSFLIQHIRPLEIGVEIIERYNKVGIYCFENIPPHPRYSTEELSG